jgi:hypothetical protein
MASFATFDDLRQRILIECIKSANSTFDQEIPGFVALAESRMWYGFGKFGEALYSEPLRCRAMETTNASFAFTSGAATLPTDYLDKRHLYWPSNPISSPNYEPPMVFWPSRTNAEGSTRPIAYTIEGTSCFIRPALSGNATLLYYKKLDALDENDDTNWILTNAPGAYFYGTLIEAWRHLRNADKLTEAIAAYNGIVSALNGTEARARFSGGRMVRRVSW